MLECVKIVFERFAYVSHSLWGGVAFWVCARGKLGDHLVGGLFWRGDAYLVCGFILGGYSDDCELVIIV